MIPLSKGYHIELYTLDNNIILKNNILYLNMYELLSDGFIKLYHIQKRNFLTKKNLNNSLSYLTLSSIEYFRNFSRTLLNPRLIRSILELKNDIGIIQNRLLIFLVKLLKDEIKFLPESLEFFSDTLTRIEVIFHLVLYDE